MRSPLRNRVRAAGLALALLAVTVLAPAEASAAPSPQARQKLVSDYQGTTVHRALGLQYVLGGDVGIQGMPWIGSHNSFNSVAEMGPTLSDTDPNQQLAITQLLDVDVRTIELDTHLIVSPRAPGAPVPVVCHARDELHLGCTAEKTLATVLDELAAWLRMPAHADQVIRLRFEDHLDGAAGQAMAAAITSQHLGDLLYRPPASAQCVVPPAALTRKAIHQAGAQIFFQGDCKGASGLRSVAFANGAYDETRPVKYTEFPACGKDFKRSDYTKKIIRYFEDSTQLTRGASEVGAETKDDGMTPITAARMARCGVDIIEMDQLLPNDGRLQSLVWSWAAGEPAARGDCAVQVVSAKQPFGRWEARSCSERHRIACRSVRGNWHVARGALPARSGAARCRRPRTSAVHSVPRTGYEAQRLRLAMRAAKTSVVWLGYRRSGARWLALDSRR